MTLGGPRTETTTTAALIAFVFHDMNGHEASGTNLPTEYIKVKEHLITAVAFVDCDGTFPFEAPLTCRSMCILSSNC